ncbi:heparinase II/III domain-containing protein [Anaerocolumna chitinilytica]|uniref:Heparinase II/III-like C-terminal domain-containing protein n=1 Tax=Anaerocolumna chitinilytica TaxID=1727145 RepID=A0A7I8DQ11_9FIRM|nr:heparinase II/III family protein [Anaerocolumna chitinilytica]BCJ98366.1 hypothetical protein bsdcttw_14070 [Anaerocolumna chitinilytica]
MQRQGWECSGDTLSLRMQIDEYVKQNLGRSIPQSLFSGYRKFIEQGSRAESEAVYFERRKQLAAFGLYLQYHRNTEEQYEEILNYFQELLWSVTNEFSWCVAAHLPQNKEGFLESPEFQIDLFAAETADTLAELLSIHADKIHPFLQGHIRRQISERIFEPFLRKNWWWETVQSNWCAVCNGCIGMAALLLEQGERKEKLLKKVDESLVHYLNSFGEDGACEEGIGYWVYGFGYYTYYIAMRKELDTSFHIEEKVLVKLRKLAEFPSVVQMNESSFVPFSDVPEKTLLPTGLLSYLQQEYEVEMPACTQITSFDFDHCFRFAHISRDLWWTDSRIFHTELGKEAVYLESRQWLLQRKDGYFFAVKGGNNQEQHNHNDTGSFLFAIDGELLLADLGAGKYTADYFGEKRYEHVHTRSRYHNLPLLQGQEQISTPEKCRVEQVIRKDDFAEITMELGKLYPVPELISLRRTLRSEMDKRGIKLTDSVKAANAVALEESFVTYIRPVLLEGGKLSIAGEKGQLLIAYENSILEYNLEEFSVENHYGVRKDAYRIGLRTRSESENITLLIQLFYEFSKS